MNTVTNTQYETVDSPKVIWNGAGLVLNDSITVRFKFSAESIEDLSARVKIGEREYVIPSDQFIKSEGKYYVYFDKLIVSQLKEDIFVTVYEGDEAVSNTVRYSVESYAYEKQNSDIANLATLVKTMMKYGNSAYNYSVQK